jgi:uncharacterized repeat protein (TIGR03943 family)
MTLDRRNVRILVLVTWSVFLLWLWLTGEAVRYLGPRTEWLVPFGGLALGLAAAAYARTPANGPPARLTTRETLGLVALLVPVAAGLLLVQAQLGALAASKKLTARGIDPTALAELASRNASELGFVQVQAAEHNSGFAAESGIEPGREVRLVGFVWHPPKTDRGRFDLARFYITCCVADSVPIGVTIQPADPRPPTYSRDDWLDVSGELVRSGEHLMLRATRIERIKAPDHPYLSFTS